MAVFICSVLAFQTNETRSQVHPVRVFLCEVVQTLTINDDQLRLGLQSDVDTLQESKFSTIMSLRFSREDEQIEIGRLWYFKENVNIFESGQRFCSVSNIM